MVPAFTRSRTASGILTEPEGGGGGEPPGMPAQKANGLPFCGRFGSTGKLDALPLPPIQALAKGFPAPL